jgi:hypothetical protein
MSQCAGATPCTCQAFQIKAFSTPVVLAHTTGVRPSSILLRFKPMCLNKSARYSFIIVLLAQCSVLMQLFQVCFFLPPTLNVKPPSLSTPRWQGRSIVGTPHAAHPTHLLSRLVRGIATYVSGRSCRGTAFRLSYEVDPKELIPNCRSSRRRRTPCHPFAFVTTAGGKRVRCALLCAAARTFWPRLLRWSAGPVSSRGNGLLRHLHLQPNHKNCPLRQRSLTCPYKKSSGKVLVQPALSPHLRRILHRVVGASSLLLIWRNSKPATSTTAGTIHNSACRPCSNILTPTVHLLLSKSSHTARGSTTFGGTNVRRYLTHLKHLNRSPPHLLQRQQQLSLTHAPSAPSSNTRALHQLSLDGRSSSTSTP